MKTLQGTVVSLKNKNTATVLVASVWQHPLYKKFVKRTKKYACHYQDMKLELGQKVTIQESKPISKTKHFVVVKPAETKKTAKKVEAKK